jgi:hypothetical protein
VAVIDVGGGLDRDRGRHVAAGSTWSRSLPIGSGVLAYAHSARIAPTRAERDARGRGGRVRRR